MKTVRDNVVFPSHARPPKAGPYGQARSSLSTIAERP